MVYLLLLLPLPSFVFCLASSNFPFVLEESVVSSEDASGFPVTFELAAALLTVELEETVLEVEELAAFFVFPIAKPVDFDCAALDTASLPESFVPDEPVELEETSSSSVSC